MKQLNKIISSLLIVLAVVMNGIQCLNLGSIFSSSNNKSEESEGRYSLGNIIQSTKDISTGVVKDVGNLLPTPEGLFDSGKQVIAGYPFTFVSTSINKFCSSAISSQAIAPKYSPDITKMNFQLRTDCQTHFYPLLEADKLVHSPYFDPAKKVVLLVSGWTTNANDTDMINLIEKAYLCRGGTNLIVVDAAAFVDTLYSWSAFNTEDIGKHIAEGLKLLADVVPLENIHLIGHSLGAHIAGAAGRYFYYNTSELIPRITGLDPAKPCFNEGENLSGLSRGDAAFVDVVHSNSGVLGKSDPTGDADFYPGGVVPLPPGCYDIVCAHGRAYEYYAESVYPGNEYNFIGIRCGSLTKLREGKCPGTGYPMGYAVPNNLKGNYFLEVNSQSPYGENVNHKLSNKDCGICNRKE